MRKKLLALLMCATMVLGTAATSFAATIDDDVLTAAGKVLTGWTGLANEFEDATIKTKVGSSTYAFVSKAHDNGTTKLEIGDYVKLNSDSKELLYVGGALDLTDYGYITSYNSTTSNNKDLAPDELTSYDASKLTNVSAVLAAYIVRNTNGNSLSDKIDAYTTAKMTQTLEDLGAEYVIANLLASDGHTNAVLLKASVPAGKAIDATEQTSGWTLVATLESKKVNGSYVYYDTDGYAFVKNESTNANSFTKGVAATGTSGATYFYTVSAIKDTDADYESLRDSVAEALVADTLSTTARAARIKLYQYGSLAGVPFISEVTTPSEVVSIKVANDLLSRTGLKSSTVDAYFVGSTQAYDEDNSITYNQIGVLSSSLDATKAYSTFSLPVAFTPSEDGYVIIFDKSADESQNDGVASETTTTTAASQTAASSPKTGDVAPITALAVVMMGACGAMVVASKKRA